MAIFLSWQSFRGDEPLFEQVIQFEGEGGIGRASDNHFVLHDPDKYVSRYHAELYISEGNWFIRDTSSTSTLINNSVSLYKGQSFLLSQGDEVKIGESTLRVEKISAEISVNSSESASNSAEQINALPAKASGSDAEKAPNLDISEIPSFVSSQENSVNEQDLARSLPTTNAQTSKSDESEISRAQPEEKTEKQAEVQNLIHTESPSGVMEKPQDSVGLKGVGPASNSLTTNDSKDQLVNNQLTEPQNDQAEAPAFNQASSAGSLIFNIDDFFNDSPEPDPETVSTTTDDSPPKVEPTIANSANAPNTQVLPDKKAVIAPEPTQDLSQDTIALRAFLKELGVNPSQLIGQQKADIMKVAGIVLKTLTEGMMGVLNARSLMKEKLELDMTQIKQVKNNPFKFSASPEEALAKMLTQESGYLDPVSAAREAVDDAKAHQMAMISGLNIAIQQTIDSFDPKSLEEEFDVGFAFSKKAKYWDVYCSIYESIAESTQSDSTNIFIKHFKEHYELQLIKLKNS